MDYSISVLGAGSYGTALAISLARNGNNVLLWGHNSTKIEKMSQERCNNEFLPGVFFPDSLDLTSDIEFVVKQSDILLIVVPSLVFSSVLKQIKDYLKPDQIIAWATKGCDPEKGRILSQVVEDVIGSDVLMVVLSGPTFAKELALGLPTAISIAGNNDEAVDRVSQLIHSSKNFRVYKNSDMVGLQIGGCVKNVIAIGAGLSDGLGFGANARTALITRGLIEIQRLGVAMGANKDSFLGMAGLGDLVLTCTDNQSRNRRFGMLLGQGKEVEEAIKQIGQVVEGYSNTREIHELALSYGIEMPICEEIYQVVYNHKSPREATATLLGRTQKIE